jgi:gliding motility-associated lipoprotein GldH
MKKFLVLAIVFSSLMSCDSNRVFESNTRVEDGSWKISDVPIFDVVISDTTSKMQAFINVRHTAYYQFANLWVFIKTTDPDGLVERDTLECLFAEKDGMWIGSGLGDLFDTQTYWKRMKFDKAGSYSFEIEQAMRFGKESKINALPGIEDVGLRIEKMEQDEI